MGYDMQIENEDPAWAEPFALASKRFSAAVAARDDIYGRGRCQEDDPLQVAVDDAYEATQRADVGHFYLNIWGMDTARKELFLLGVMNDAKQEPWPKRQHGWPDAWLDGGKIVDDDENEVDPTSLPPGMVDFIEAERRVREGPPPGDVAGIPLYKVGSNDDWLVTPGEIRTGLGWADAHHPGWRDVLSDFVAEFVVWMEFAAEHGGFRVG